MLKEQVGQVYKTHALGRWKHCRADPTSVLILLPHRFAIWRKGLALPLTNVNYCLFKVMALFLFQLLHTGYEQLVTPWLIPPHFKNRIRQNAFQSAVYLDVFGIIYTSAKVHGRSTMGSYSEKSKKLNTRKTPMKTEGGSTRGGLFNFGPVEVVFLPLWKA